MLAQKCGQQVDGHQNLGSDRLPEVRASASSRAILHVVAREQSEERNVGCGVEQVHAGRFEEFDETGEISAGKREDVAHELREIVQNEVEGSQVEFAQAFFQMMSVDAEEI